MSTVEAPDWRSSLEWLQDIRPLITPRAYASFILTHLSMTAIRAGDGSALPRLLGEALRRGRPGISDLLVFFGNRLLPRRIHGGTARIYSRIAGRAKGAAE